MDRAFKIMSICWTISQVIVLLAAIGGGVWGMLLGRDLLESLKLAGVCALLAVVALVFPWGIGGGLAFAYFSAMVAASGFNDLAKRNRK